ncbi:polymorphic toxin type 4 domain-containing protein [Actinomycetospora straminea]|uniref:Bacterial toxin 4 domain-containing protein n=1 Tax=Actinomycetospora straminea TaxID=663607 RepID=A0ABP9EQR3_9PSEU|nr:polymorphic toxin type 4 domain-containing protein [Actinomycetospora straminea]MDD7933732.1 polymorphic toxin type 4 domain-containing protein [Actinomycetospora straminea]
MTIGAAALQPAIRAWARRQARTLNALERALEIVYRDRPGIRTLDELTTSLLLAVMRRHEATVDGALHQIDDVMARLMEDVDRLRTAAAQGRPPTMREADLHVLAEALAEMVSFQDRVQSMLDTDPTRVQEILRDIVGAQPSPVPRPPIQGAPTLVESRRRGAEVLRWAEEVLAAHAAGRTLEVNPVRVRPHPRLIERLERMREAMAAYRSTTHSDPVAAHEAAEELRRMVAEANETLRLFGDRFEVRTTGDRVVPTRPDPAAAAGTVDADLLAVRHALTAERVHAPAGELFGVLTVAEPTVRADGVLGEPLARDLPDVGLEKHLPTPDDIRGLPTDPPWLAARLADLLTSAGHEWERAHLIGPGFGAELFEGITLAPRGVNQIAQNRGIEGFLRHAAETVGGDVRVAAEVHSRRLAIPLAGGTFEHIDVMESVHYRVPVQDGPPLIYDIYVNPDGSWHVEHNLPAGVLDIPTGGSG